MIVTLLTLVIGALVIAVLWYRENAAIIDRGDDPENPRKAWNLHSKFHIAGAAVTAFPAGLADGPMNGFIVAFVLWFLVEIAQRFPRDKQGGVIEWADVWWNAVGAFLGAWLGAFVSTLV